jgi:hypothetical protein
MDVDAIDQTIIFLKISEFSLIDDEGQVFRLFIQSGRGIKNPPKRFTLPA